MYDLNDQEDGRYYNNAFIERLKEEGAEKAAAAITDYIRVKVREEGFARPILNSVPITQLELDVDQNTDTPVKFIDLEPDSQGYALTFREKGPEQWYKGKRARIDFANYRSEAFRSTLGELATYRSPIKKIVHDNHLLDIMEKEDSTFVNGIEKIIAVTGKTFNAAVDGFTARTLTQAVKQLTDDKLPIGTVLINESSFQDIVSWPSTQIGDNLASEISVNGWTASRLLGYNFVRTTKTDIVPDGVIYIFAPSEYLGRHYVLHDVQTYFKQEGPEIEFYVWEDIGMGISNTKAVAKFIWTA